MEAFTAAARGQPEDTLRYARGTLAYASALGISHEYMRWAWPLAARAAHELGDTAATRELLALLDDCPPGHVAPMLRAERDLARARLASHDSDQAAAPSLPRSAACGSSAPPTIWPTACSTTPSTSPDWVTPRPLRRPSRKPATSPDSLRCQPLLDRAADLAPAESRIRA